MSRAASARPGTQKAFRVWGLTYPACALQATNATAGGVSACSSRHEIGRPVTTVARRSVPAMGHSLPGREQRFLSALLTVGRLHFRGQWVGVGLPDFRAPPKPANLAKGGGGARLAGSLQGDVDLEEGNRGVPKLLMPPVIL